MRQEPKNEIDQLLRQLGRREGDSLFETPEHPDADEMNAYVANALPAAARARYMEHLADCASCRKLAVQLSAAQGPVAVAAVENISERSGLKQFFASLFSPLVLRYAVPALGVFVIMVVGFVVMRRETSQQFVADVKRPAQVATEAVQASPSPPSLAEGLVNQQSRNAPAAEKPLPIHGDRLNDAKGEGPTAASASEPSAKTPETQALATAPEPVTPPRAKVAETETEDAQRHADQEKKASADAVRPAKPTEVAVQQRQEEIKDQPKRAGMAAAQGAGASRGLEAGQLAKSTATSDERDSDKQARDEARGNYDAVKEKNEAAAETRSVAGRRFRKSGNVWIDTAYKPSQKTFSLARGSESYQVLVADEPEIRRIAEQLDGEIIVVWKGRAYRIR